MEVAESASDCPLVDTRIHDIAIVRPIFHLSLWTIVFILFKLHNKTNLSQQNLPLLFFFVEVK